MMGGGPGSKGRPGRPYTLGAKGWNIGRREKSCAGARRICLAGRRSKTEEEEEAAWRERSRNKNRLIYGRGRIRRGGAEDKQEEAEEEGA